MLVGVGFMDRLQQLAISSNARRLQIFGPPGTGKTKVLANRIARLIAEGTEPERVVALTFTHSACASLRKSIAQILNDPELAERVRIRTFHRFCQELIRLRPDAIGLEPHWEMTDFLDMQNMLYYPFSGVDRRKRFQTNYVTPDLQRQSQNMLQRLSTYDFNQALEFGQRILETYDPEITHLVLDEFQDCSAGQWRLVKAILAASPSSHFVAAGDPNQAIFTFQNGHLKSEVNIMSEEFLETQSVQLKYNYRSSKQVVNLIQHIMPSKEALISTLPEGDEPRLSFHQTNLHVLCEITDIVKRLCCVENPQFSFDDIAVLVRLNSQARSIIGRLEAEGIPARQEQSIRALGSHKMPSVALTLMKWCLTPRDFYLLQLLYNRFHKFIDDAAFRALIKKMSTSEKSLSELLVEKKRDRHPFLTDFLPNVRQSILKSTTPKEVADHVKTALESWHEVEGGPDAGNSMERVHFEPFVALMNQGSQEISTDDYTQDEGGALRALLQYCFARDNTAALARRDGYVNVSTIHSAKSNQWPVVLVPSMFWRGQSEAKLNPLDERRLQYVAASRAQKQLHFMNLGAIIPGSRNSFLPVPKIYETMSLSDAKARYPLVFQPIPLTRRIFRSLRI